MHRAFYGLRPAFGIGRDYMGADGMQKAAVILGGINGPTDDIVDPFLGDVQTVSPPQPPAPHRIAAPSHLQAPLTATKTHPFPLKPKQQPRSIDYRPPQQAHPPTPISTLLAFKKQIRTDAARTTTKDVVQAPIPAAAPVPAMMMMVEAPLTPPLDSDMEMMLMGENFDFTQELEALQQMGAGAVEMEDLEKAMSLSMPMSTSMSTWNAIPPPAFQQQHLTYDSSVAAIPMDAISTQLPRHMPGLSALHAPASKPVATVKATPHQPTPRAKGYVHKACVSCKVSHVACDVTRPCQRCVKSGKASSCIDAERKKRGRPTGTSIAVQKPSMSMSPELSATASPSFALANPTITTSATAPTRPKKRSRQDSASNILQPPHNYSPTEIGSQLLRLQASIAESQEGGFVVTDEVLGVLQSLSALIPQQSQQQQQQPQPHESISSFDDLSFIDVKREDGGDMEDALDAESRVAADAATAMLESLRGTYSQDQDEAWRGTSAVQADIQLDNAYGAWSHELMAFADPTLLPAQVVTKNDMMDVSYM
ncbi:hypothetical protein HKX48_004959 [Thoreauomyces humboldtii]|nr:hypothetical protein HKX48_004959 [Thoreauomyces humboldtii]